MTDPDPDSDTGDASRCPLCGGDNRCGLARGETVCWCFDAAIDRKTIDAVPPSDRDRVCICPACARPIRPSAEGAAGGEGPSAPTGPGDVASDGSRRTSRALRMPLE